MTKSWPWKLWLGALVVVAALLVVFLQDDRNRAVLLDNPGRLFSSGDLQAGCKFGVCVGQETQRVVAELRARNYSVSVDRLNQCLFVDFHHDLAVVVAGDASWRRGTVCVATDNGRATRIVWSYNPMAP